jgi:hypothetical protein
MRDSARDRFIGCEHNTQQQHLVCMFEFVVSTTLKRLLLLKLTSGKR